jgi:hypothetical protein
MMVQVEKYRERAHYAKAVAARGMEVVVIGPTNTQATREREGECARFFPS